MSSKQDELIKAAVALVREGARLDERRRKALERLAGSFLARAVAG